MEDQDLQRLYDRLERLGVQRVRLLSAVDCERFFGGWQIREAIDAWLEAKAAERRPSGWRSSFARRLSLF